MRHNRRNAAPAYAAMASLGLLLAGAAGATTLDKLPKEVCKTDEGASPKLVDNRYIVDQLVLNNGVHMTLFLATPIPDKDIEARAKKGFGTRVQATVQYCAPDGPNAKADFCTSGETGRVIKLADDYDLLIGIEARQSGESSYRVSFKEGKKPDIEAFLNGDNATVDVTCPAKTPPPPKKTPERGQWRVAGSYDDLDGEELGDTSFATLAAVNDRAGGDRTVASNLAIGYMLPSADTFNQTHFVYASYDKSTSRNKGEVENDVAVGYYFHNDVNNFGLDISAHTDDRGRSQLYRLAADWRIQVGRNWLPTCQTEGNIVLYCIVTVAADYVGVGHTGDREALKDIKEYTRLGLDGEYKALFPLADDAVLILSAQYQKRFALSGKGDAELQQYSIGLAPDKKAHFNLSLSYSYGKSLVDLTPVKKTMITLGYRR